MADRIAFVTGAAGGLGREIADALVHIGNRVVYADLQQPSDLPDSPRVMPLACDVAEPAAVDAAFDAVEARWGSVQLLVCAAGVLRKGSITSTTEQDVTALLNVNVAGTFRCVRRAVPAMQGARWGRILLLASVAGLTGGSPGLAAYAMSKGAVITLTKAVAREVAADGITVNALAPALIETAMTDGLYGEPPPVGRLGTPQDVARMATLLLADEADYITGQLIGIDGGFQLS